MFIVLYWLVVGLDCTWWIIVLCDSSSFVFSLVVVFLCYLGLVIWVLTCWGFCLRLWVVFTYVVMILLWIWFVWFDLVWASAFGVGIRRKLACFAFGVFVCCLRFLMWSFVGIWIWVIGCFGFSGDFVVCAWRFILCFIDYWLCCLIVFVVFSVFAGVGVCCLFCFWYFSMIGFVCNYLWYAVLVVSFVWLGCLLD